MQVSKKTRNKPKSKNKNRSKNSIRAKMIEKPDYYDYSLVAAIILLTCFGLIMLYSTSAYTSTIRFNDDMYFFKKQTAISFVCIAGALFISMFDYHILAKFTGVLYAVAAILSSISLACGIPLAISAAWAAILEAMIPCLTSSTFGSARCSAGVT